MASSDPGSSLATPVPWEIKPVDPSEVKFKDRVEVVTSSFHKNVLEACGGPAQYLEKKLSGQAAQDSFLSWLWKEFPLRSDKLYNLDTPLPTVNFKERAESLPSKVHIGTLGFMMACSLKPPPSSHAAHTLCQHLLTEGFLSSDKPLLVKHLHDSEILAGLSAPWSKEACGQPLAAFSLGYVKGMLRASTVLALLHLFWEDGNGSSLLAAFPTFKESCEVVYVHHVSLPSVESEVFNNFLISIRDSISKPPNFMTWLHTLRALKKRGYDDSAAVISRFNQLVAKSSWLVGSKATALGNFLTLIPENIIELLQGHVSKWGWESCVLSDDALSSKKLLPNHVFKAPHKSWKKLCAMSPVATELAFKRLIRDHEKPGAVRKKAAKDHMESVAETACLLSNLATQLMETFPISRADVEKHIFEPWLEGAHGWDLEMH